MILLLLLLTTPPPETPDVDSSGDEFQRWVEETFYVEEKDDPEVEENSEETRPATPTYNTGQTSLLALTINYNPDLTPHPTLMASAQRVANYHAQTGRWGHSSRSSRPNASENIAWNSSRSVNKIASQWKNSRGHNSNWLTDWNYVGVGVAYTNGRIYAVQHFSNNPTGGGNSVTLQSSRSTRTYSTSRSRRWGIFRRRR